MRWEIPAFGLAVVKFEKEMRLAGQENKSSGPGIKGLQLGPEVSGLLIKVLGSRIEKQTITIQLMTQGKVMRSCDKAARFLGQSRN